MSLEATQAAAAVGGTLKWFDADLDPGRFEQAAELLVEGFPGHRSSIDLRALPTERPRRRARSGQTITSSFGRLASATSGASGRCFLRRSDWFPFGGRGKTRAVRSALPVVEATRPSRSVGLRT